MGDLGICPKCGNELKRKLGSRGAFIGCSGYPSCKYTKSAESNGLKDLTATYYTPWVNASSIGSARFCPNTVYLRAVGVQTNLKNKFAQNRGNFFHWRASRRRRACYIATYAFSEQHLIVESLRQWRDARLSQTLCGRIFIELYYLTSPILIFVLGRFPFFHKCAKKFVTWFHKNFVRGRS